MIIETPRDAGRPLPADHYPRFSISEARDRQPRRRPAGKMPYRNAGRRQDRPSVDRRGVMFETSLDRMNELKNEPRLELLSKLVYFFRPETGFNMVTESEAPAGAGLAGSSTLNIACIGALNTLVGNRYTPDRFIPIAANIECQVIKVPTGFQDYYSAQYGGAASIHFSPDGITREPLNIDLKTLHDRVVTYTANAKLGTNNGR